MSHLKENISDLSWQVRFVVDNAWRLIHSQDRNPLSPSYGSYDTSYWRDKKSEFSDIRMQEAGAALGLLLHNKIYQRYNKILPPKELLSLSVKIGFAFLKKCQYKNGTFDEWYKGERGFAATEFPLVAFVLFALLVKKIDRELKKEIINTFQVSVDWLCKNSDIIKSNHEMAAIAGIAAYGTLTNNIKYKRKAKEKFEKLLSRRDINGWFPEIGGLDLGYCCVFLDYLQIYKYYTPKFKYDHIINDLVNFICDHINPNTTIHEETGICLNSYMSRFGMVMSSELNEKAKNLKIFWENHTLKEIGVEPILADDLRFHRWAYLPLITFLMTPKTTKKKKFKCEKDRPFGWNSLANTGIAIYKSKNIFISLAAASGGHMQIFLNNKILGEIKPPLFKFKNKLLSTTGYENQIIIDCSSRVASFTCNLITPAFFFPSLLQRLILRFLCINPFLSKKIRQFIDGRRLRYKTAINQSAGTFKSKSTKIKARTTISVINDDDLHLEYLIGPLTGGKKIDMELSGRIHNNYYKKNRSLSFKPRSNENYILCNFNVSFSGKIKDLNLSLKNI